jgi:threonine/homoserine/homoserine lactone efflux protein
MQWVQYFICGWALAFIGVAIPGLVNMTVANQSMRHGFKAGLLACTGASFVIFLQAKIAVGFSHYLSVHAEVLTNIKIVAILIFLILSAVFFYQALRPKVQRGKSNAASPMLRGIAASGMNVLNIPFYFTATAYLEARGWIIFRPYSGWWVALGAGVGAYAILWLYAYMAGYLTRHAPAISRGANYFLSVLFLLLAFVQWIQLYFV